MATGTSRGLMAVLLGVVMIAGVGALMTPTRTEPGVAVVMHVALPEAPRGWELDRSAGMSEGSHDVSAGGVSRTYRRNDLRVTIRVTRSASAVVAARASGRNVADPQTLALMGTAPSGTVHEAIDRPGWQGWTAMPEQGEATALVYRGNVLVRITGTPPSSRAIEVFLDALDWDALELLADGRDGRGAP